jgi:hypothetical protein
MCECELVAAAYPGGKATREDAIGALWREILLSHGLLRIGMDCNQK